jgi:RimJ/RimL family protein N-acetyltransferase
MDAAACELDFFEGVLKRFLGLPWDILETDRCIIRETTVEDVDGFYELYKDKEITEYMENLFEDREEEIEYTKSYIKNVYEFYGFGMWTVLDKATGEVIGRAGVSYRDGYELPELGFMIGKKYQRRGLAYEVCSAILKYMRDNYAVDEVLIFIEPQNTPSILLAKKLGANLYKEKCMGKCDAYIMKIPQ